ncbi:hypothetical protein EDB84DRAFT_926030 [Lactarius hengduanensis]|nr:hypothetical protein EDB84DRAFT_926030 [Lactarius hengduanensis]
MTPIWRFYRRAATRNVLLVSQTRATAAVDITASDRGLLIGGTWRRYLRRARACPFYLSRERSRKSWQRVGVRRSHCLFSPCERGQTDRQKPTPCRHPVDRVKHTATIARVFFCTRKTRVLATILGSWEVEILCRSLLRCCYSTHVGLRKPGIAISYSFSWEHEERNHARWMVPEGHEEDEEEEEMSPASRSRA